MITIKTVLPPTIYLAQGRIYAQQGSVYALDALNGVTLQTYPTLGYRALSIANDILYLNVNRHPDAFTQALHLHDGSLLWTYKTEKSLVGAPVIGNGAEVVYTNTARGQIYALQANDGSLLWQFRIDLGPDVLPALGPFIHTAPLVAGEILYLAPSVNNPLRPFLYALRAKDGKLLWKVPLPASSHFPLTIVEGVIYIAAHNSWLAFDAHNGSVIWQERTNALTCADTVSMNGILYTSSTEILHEFTPSGRWGHQRHAFLCARRASDGTLLWRQEIGVGENSEPTSPAVAQNIICVGMNDGSLYTFLASSGAPLWSYQTGGNFLSTPIIGENNIVYVGANDGNVYALQMLDGTLLWKTFVSTALSSVFSFGKIEKKE
ncbi:hypothetical protein EPA93_28345 [Ktedonosporobacter rubrisoli]|uniref:Pyrrolo-quinoline quinone repeat domain-containing protein n=1 Tax=Ktedonosporobacter rubrisoli TaxID=2509675 RepID=A0A4P6JVJ1_KTERU|nr:PQQ-binding-like beta-propeller repeat protein [Ktedonosporobacter rubrisoli]QBD79677.1 hypothetical protein EPA93_28345 [Ktedonosporobacter rubrisoli]